MKLTNMETLSESPTVHPHLAMFVISAHYLMYHHFNQKLFDQRTRKEEYKHEESLHFNTWTISTCFIEKKSI